MALRCLPMCKNFRKRILPKEEEYNEFPYFTISASKKKKKNPLESLRDHTETFQITASNFECRFSIAFYSFSFDIYIDWVGE